MTRIGFVPQITISLNNRTMISFTSNGDKEKIEADKYTKDQFNYDNETSNADGNYISDDERERAEVDKCSGYGLYDGDDSDVNPYADYSKTEAFSLSKDEKFENPLLVGTITRLYDEVIKKGNVLPTELISEGYSRNPKNKVVKADNPEARILTRKVKLNEDTYVLLGIDRNIIRKNGWGTQIKDPEAFIKIVDKNGKPKTEKEMYYTASYASFDMDPIKFALHNHYDKLLLKIANKVCAN